MATRLQFGHRVVQFVGVDFPRATIQSRHCPVEIALADAPLSVRRGRGIGIRCVQRVQLFAGGRKRARGPVEALPSVVVEPPRQNGFSTN